MAVLTSVDSWLDVRLVHFIMACVLIEALVLTAWLWRTGRRALAPAWLATLASGFCLMGALAAALDQGGFWPAWLAAAGAAHLLDLWLRVPLRRARDFR
ncbi:hypothetical protein [Methyloversatilis thermotolerans]|uniref:hypothetical protein n=1 Tax=Methyloversatilis thermotolerans TaxID=1346290 RepID=UPI00037CB97D|nr:hypothetical protein [Methyloversatilis thermotolerans]